MPSAAAQHRDILGAQGQQRPQARRSDVEHDLGRLRAAGGDQAQDEHGEGADVVRRLRQLVRPVRVQRHLETVAVRTLELRPTPTASRTDPDPLELEPLHRPQRLASGLFRVNLRAADTGPRRATLRPATTAMAASHRARARVRTGSAPK